MSSVESVIEEVRLANREFYRAFESLRVERMRQCWLELENVHVKCVHPGWRPLFGFEAVLESWARIFAHTGYMEFQIADEVIFVDGDLAVVSCAEILRTAPEAGAPIRTAAGDAVVLEGAVHATNVYRRHDGAWKMIVHHAS